MSSWTIEFRKEAELDLVKLDRNLARRILEKIEWLGIHFNEIIPITLTAEFREFYKLRIGDWRVLYKINNRTRVITIFYIDRRDKIYKMKRK